MEHVLISLSAVLVLGIAAQWLGWRLKLPSILILLLAGIVAGPVTGFIDPRTLAGPLLYPTVSLAVALILFEGGLSLTLKEFRSVGGATLRLIVIGAPVSLALTAVAGHWILGLDWGLSLLLGAILVVTGPTVIGPLLQQIRPSGAIGPILKWEGIVIDPLGAMLAVLVFQILSTGDAPLPIIAATVAKTLVVGSVLGLAAAALLVILLRRFWVPDFLENPVALMLVVCAFTLANLFQHESGLLAVTVMGFVLGNQKFVPVHHIVEFKETLRVMLLGFIFILLAASLEPADLGLFGFASIEFLIVLIVIVRPAAALAATLGSQLSRQERFFLACVAPRGIVAAAVSSIFALRLSETGYPGGEKLAAVTFLVIIGTVAVYGLGAAPLAKRLGLAKAQPQGILFLGGRFWVRRVAKFLKDEGFAVMIVDDNRRNVLASRMEGVPATYASVFSEPVLEQVELGGLGRLLAMTSNDDSNSLACVHFARVFGRDQIYQLAPDEPTPGVDGTHHLRGRMLFGPEVTHTLLTQRFLDDWSLKKTRLGEEFDFEAFRTRYGDDAIPLFLVTENGQLRIFNRQEKLAPEPGQTLISLVHANAD